MIVQHDSAAILAYDFHEIHKLLSDNSCHVWFPKAGFDRVDEMRTSAYDDADFPLLDIGHIGPKGFWLFGQIVHPTVAPEQPGEAYIGVFSNARPTWQDQTSDFYKEQIEASARKPVKDAQDAYNSFLDDLGRNVLDFDEYAFGAAVEQAVAATYQDGINRADWLNAAKALLETSVNGDVTVYRDKAETLAGMQIDLWNLQRIWPDSLPQDYFADRDWYVGGRNIWILQVGTREEFGDFQTFKERVSQARVHISDNDFGNLACSYDIPMPDGSSERLSLDYGGGGQFQLNGTAFPTDLYPRFENPFIRGGRVEWGQREYVIEYNGKSLLHDFSDFSLPIRQEAVASTADDRNIIKALVIFLRTGDASMDTFTVATVDVTLGCSQGTWQQVVAAGPIDPNTDHDAEWIFLDAPALRAPDMTITMTHPAASTAGNDTPHWKMSFTLRALIGDRTVRDCSLSFSFFEFVDDKRRSWAFPFSVVLAEWRPWEVASDDKPLAWWTIAHHRPFSTDYHDATDLIGLDDTGLLWHRRLKSCRADEDQWFVLPAGGGAGPNLSTPMLASAVSAQPGSLVFFLQSGGRLFAASPSQVGPFTAGWLPLDVFIYPDGVFGLPDPSAPPIPIALAASSPFVAIPSSVSADGIEIYVLGGDGQIYSHPDWRMNDAGPWRKIEVAPFASLFGQGFLVAGDRLLILADDGTVWATAVDHTTLHLIPAWDKLPALGVVDQVSATWEDDGACQVVAATTDGRLLATTYHPGNSSAWVELDLPGTIVAPGSTLASALPSAGSSQFFAAGADGRIYTITVDSSAGWSTSLAWSSVEPDPPPFTPRAGGNLAAASRVNGQVEVFAQDVDRKLFRAWWS